MTERRMKLTPTTLALVGALTVSLVGAGWLQVGAQPLSAQGTQTSSIEMGSPMTFEVDSNEVDPFQIAAQTIGIDEEILWTELEAGQTVAQVSQANGVDPQVVIDAVLAAEIALIDQELADGHITEAEAQEWRAEAQEFIPNAINKTLDELEAEFDEGEFEDGDFVEDEFMADYLEPIAAFLGIDVGTLEAELESGKSLAQIAQANGKYPQALINHMVTQEQALIDEMVKAGEITAEEAAEWSADLVKTITFEVNHVEADLFDVAAQTIGITADELWSELEAGKTVAQVSQAKGVDPQAVVNAVLASENALIDQYLAAGLITEEEAQEWRAETMEFVNDAINKTLDELEAEFDEGEFEDGDFVEDEFMADYLEPIAAFLGIDVGTLEAELESGKSLAQIAQANGKDPQALINHMVTQEQALIDEMVKAGEITAEEAAEWSADLVKTITFEVNHVEADPFDVAAQTIGITADALWSELEAGKTVALVSQEKGVDPQTVVNAVLASENAQIDQYLAAGLITEEEAQEWRAEIAEVVNYAINKTLDELEMEFDEEDFSEDDGLNDEAGDAGQESVQATGQRSANNLALYLPVLSR